MKFPWLVFAPLTLAIGGCSAVAAQNGDIQDTAIISDQAHVLTMVNVLTPPKGGQAAAVAQLQKALDTSLLDQPGFISASVHRSLDSDHVAVYAQWKDQPSLMAFVAKLEAGEAPEMLKAYELAKPNYHPYAVESVHLGLGK